MIRRSPDEFKSKLAQVFKSSDKELNLPENEINDMGAYYIVKALKNNQTITKINLLKNKITDRGVIYLSSAIKKNQTLNEINLCQNEIENLGVKYLADALVKHPSLTHINLSENRIDDEGAKYLTYVLEKNKTLTQINLMNNKITEEFQNQIDGLLQKNKNHLNINKLLKTNSNLQEKLSEVIPVDTELIKKDEVNIENNFIKNYLNENENREGSNNSDEMKIKINNSNNDKNDKIVQNCLSTEFKTDINENKLMKKRKSVIIQQMASTLACLHKIDPLNLDNNIKTKNFLVPSSEKLSIGLCKDKVSQSINNNNKTQTQEGKAKLMSIEIFKHCKNELGTCFYYFGILIWDVLSGKALNYDGYNDTAVINNISESGRQDLNKCSKQCSDSSNYLKEEMS